MAPWDPEQDRWEDDLSTALGDLVFRDDVWCLRPQLWLAMSSMSRTAHPWKRRLRRLSSVQVADVGLGEGVHGSTFVWTTANQRRAFGSLPSSERRLVLGAGARVGAAVATQRQFSATVRTLTAAVSTHGEPEPDVVTRLLIDARRAISTARRVLDEWRVGVLVVATQHSTTVRGFIVAAREREIPVVYVPHAPFASNRQYADLPVDLACLRGPAEVTAYRALGADDDGLAVCGDLSVPDRDVAPQRAQEVIVAPSPWDDDRAEAFFAVVGAADIDRLVVCPHPASDITQLRRRLPPQARLLEGVRTLDRVLATGGLVVQHSSGVALEAMLVGAPVVQVELPGAPAGYPCIVQPHVTRVSSGPELKEEWRRISGGPPSGRQERMRWARMWTESSGVEAAARLHQLIKEASPRRTPVLDGWRPAPT